MRQSLDNRTQSLEVDTRLSHSKRDLWRPSREEAYLSHIWWRISRDQYCNIGPRVRAALYLAYILITRSEVGVQKEIYIYREVRREVRRDVRRNHRGRFGGRFGEIIEGGSAGGSAKS